MVLPLQDAPAAPYTVPGPGRGRGGAGGAEAPSGINLRWLCQGRGVDQPEAHEVDQDVDQDQGAQGNVDEEFWFGAERRNHNGHLPNVGDGNHDGYKHKCAKLGLTLRK